MKRQIRRGCFETNSSSMHSLIITKEDKYYTPEECESGAWVFDGKLSMRYDMEFERSPFDILSTFASKLRYAIASLCGGYCKREDADNIFDEQFLPIIKEVLPEVSEVEFREGERHVFYDDDGNEIEPKWDHQTMEPYYIDKNGKKKEADDEWIEDGRDYGYVDHQSVGLLQSFLKNEGITLKEFLTNKKYIVIIDGDETDTFGKLKEAKLINTDEIVRQYPPISSYDSYSWMEANKDEKTNQN